MDPERQRIQDDLRGLVSGDVCCDDLFLQLYSSDASLYEIKPLGVVRPRNTADVVTVVKYAAEKRIPIHARGAGTGLAGESIGTGLIVDFSRYMNHILRTDAETVRVQPGVIHAQLNRHLSSLDRTFGPDPSNSSVTTMGSVIALDASGSFWLRYGSARRHVESLQIVLADGTLMEVNREPLDIPEDSAQARRRQLVTGLAELLRNNRELIERHRPRSLINSSGYQLGDVLTDTELDLARLLVGSEGTLAIVTEATVGTQPLPKHRGVVVLLFDRLESAALAAQDVLPFGPSACDLLDRRHLGLARETRAEFELLIPAEAEAVLLVEKADDDPAAVRDALGQIVDRIVRKKQLAFDFRQAIDRADVDLYWQLARHVVPTLHRIKGSTRPIPIVEDVGVPPETLPDFLVRLQNILKSHQVTASLYGHAGHGELHIRPFLDLADPEDVLKMEPLAADLYGEVLQCGGTISGEHGDGLSRTPFLRQQYGPLYEVFREVKNLFDPQNIFNPGKVIADPPAPLARNLRPLRAAPSTNGNGATAGGAVASTAPPTVIELQLHWDVEQLRTEANRCNGCGACRSQLPDVRMCPIYRISPSEEASPRAKANMMRAVLSGRLGGETVTHDDFKEVADLCVNCHQCRLECPAGVDIPKLMAEAKASYVEANGLRPSDWMLTRFYKLSALGSALSPVANWAISNRAARWMLERLLGIAQGRKLPRFAQRSFLRRATRRRLTRPTRRSGRKVLYFVDTFANYHDPQLAEALVAVMEHNGVAVYVHPAQRPSGMGLYTAGAVEPARRLAVFNIHLLADAVRQGYQIVATEPSTVLCLTHEYLNLLDDAEARAVAANTSDACDYLWQLHQQGQLRLDLKPVHAAMGYHQPCHIRALEIGSPSLHLLRLVPGLSVQPIERGCSGMAGLWGLKRENYRSSLRAGWGLISRLREPSIQVGVTECSSCKIQMEQGTPKPTLHPLKILAHSYGLMPDVARLLASRGEELVIT